MFREHSLQVTVVVQRKSGGRGILDKREIIRLNLNYSLWEKHALLR